MHINLGQLILERRACHDLLKYPTSCVCVCVDINELNFFFSKIFFNRKKFVLGYFIFYNQNNNGRHFFFLLEN